MTAKTTATGKEEYNGYPTYDHWNVSLWINNDESLYRWAMRLVEKGVEKFGTDKGLDRAAREMYSELKNRRTPDGVRYTLKKIRYAIGDLLD